MPKIACIIPSRYASTRLPGKPLVEIAGKPMIQRVYERAKLAECVDTVIVATDDVRIEEAVRSFGGEVVMTSNTHETGTDRLAEVAKRFPDIDFIINVQGDEPLVDPKLIDALAIYFLETKDAVMVTAAAPLDEADYENPDAVKVVLKQNGDALYFSRALIPYPRTAGFAHLKHMGIYGYSREFLLMYQQLPQTPLEKAESLEQLRALEHGYTIHVIEAEAASPGVDTPADVLRVTAIIEKGENR